MHKKVRGVIVFTDPDYPGRRIRAIIEERYSNGVNMHFLIKKKQLLKMVKDLESNMLTMKIYVRQFDPSIQMEDSQLSMISLADLMEAKSNWASGCAKERRERLSELLANWSSKWKRFKKTT